MPTLIATAGASNANAFVSVADTDTYMDARLNASAWTGEADEDVKERALIEATRELNLWAWKGNRTTSTQALAWPRDLVHNPDSPNFDYFANTVIPQRVKDATCELALEFLKAGTTDVAALERTANVARKKTDVLETDYVAPQFRAKGLARYPRVIALIAPLAEASSLTVPTVRG
jgi:hypothetical protein